MYIACSISKQFIIIISCLAIRDTFLEKTKWKKSDLIKQKNNFFQTFTEEVTRVYMYNFYFQCWSLLCAEPFLLFSVIFPSLNILSIYQNGISITFVSPPLSITSFLSILLLILPLLLPCHFSLHTHTLSLSLSDYFLSHFPLL